MSREYRQGFEDALELVLTKLRDAKDLKSARRCIEQLLGAVLEDKLARLEEQLLLDRNAH